VARGGGGGGGHRRQWRRRLKMGSVEERRWLVRVEGELRVSLFIGDRGEELRPQLATDEQGSSVSEHGTRTAEDICDVFFTMMGGRGWRVGRRPQPREDERCLTPLWSSVREEDKRQRRWRAPL
jgi:hypothetical protein